jgi:hypothetical protein
VIEPLRIVDYAKQRQLLGTVGEQTKRGEADEEAIGWRTGAHADGRSERVALMGYQAPKPVEERGANKLQRGVGQLHLGLHPEGAEDPEPLGLLGGIVEQGGLADPRFTEQHEDRTLSRSHVEQQLIDPRTLGGAISEHRSAAPEQLEQQWAEALRVAICLLGGGLTTRQEDQGVSP